MNKSRLLWMLVVVDVLLAFGSVGAEGLFGWTLPPELAAYRHSQFHMGPGGAFHLLLIAVCALIAFASWIGLVSFWRHGRGLYVFSWALWILYVLVSGPRVRTSIGSAFGVMNAVVGGVILGLVYFSDLAHRFEGTPAENVAPAGTNLGTGQA